MSGFGILDEAMEQVEAGVTQIKQTPADMAKTAKAQVVQAVKGSGDTGSGTNEAAQQHVQQQSGDQAQHADHQKATDDFVKDLYAPSNGHSGNGQQKQPSQFFQDKIADGMTPEEASKYEALRKKLHDEYYTLLTERKPHEVEQQEEEQEKEQEKMEALHEEEEKKQKDQPIAVQMGANRAEQFPGASG